MCFITYEFNFSWYIYFFYYWQLTLFIHTFIELFIECFCLMWKSYEGGCIQKWSLSLGSINQWNHSVGAAQHEVKEQQEVRGAEKHTENPLRWNVDTLGPRGSSLTFSPSCHIQMVAFGLYVDITRISLISWNVLTYAYVWKRRSRKRKGQKQWRRKRKKCIRVNELLIKVFASQDSKDSTTE